MPSWTLAFLLFAAVAVLLGFVGILADAYLAWGVFLVWFALVVAWAIRSAGRP